MNVRSALKDGSEYLREAGIEQHSLEAEVILTHLLGKGREFFYAHPEEELGSYTWEKFQQIISKRVQRLPLAYVTGQREFMSLDFKVNESVMVPRPETELLVEEILDILGGWQGNGGRKQLPIVLDIGTGCGNIALSLAQGGSCFVYGTDISRQALGIARENRRKLNLENRARFISCNLWEYFRHSCWKQKMSLVVSNPPYVRTKERLTLSPEVSLYEPRLALDGGKDGMSFFPEIVEGGVFLLQKGGYLVLEVGYGQARRVKNMMENVGIFEEIRTKKDYNHIERVIIARRR